MMRHLILNLEAPMMSFGGETIDNLGVIRPFPAASMLVGLFANALGWRRVERERHQRLQDRLVFAARIDREPAGGVRMTDFQTAQLGASDQGWTTRGRPEGRAGGPNTYNAPHLRYRDYYADMRVTVALRLRADDGAAPTLDELAAGLDEPMRPLFIGRKSCLPSCALYGGFADGDTALAALVGTPLHSAAPASESIRAMWPEGEGVSDIAAVRTGLLTDQRNWVSGLHGGGRMVCAADIPASCFAADREPEGEPAPAGAGERQSEPAKDGAE